MKQRPIPLATLKRLRRAARELLALPPRDLARVLREASRLTIAYPSSKIRTTSKPTR